MPRMPSGDQGMRRESSPSLAALASASLRVRRKISCRKRACASMTRALREARRTDTGRRASKISRGARGPFLRSREGHAATDASSVCPGASSSAPGSTPREDQRCVVTVPATATAGADPELLPPEQRSHSVAPSSRMHARPGRHGELRELRARGRRSRVQSGARWAPEARSSSEAVVGPPGRLPSEERGGVVGARPVRPRESGRCA